MNEPSDHAISLFSEMLQNYQDRENRRTQLMPSDIDVIRYLIFCAKISTSEKASVFLSKLEL